ncbi:hypothetical protein OKJ48_43990 [Streptomyces kunmingensis]|uniref:Uncharacterized protein n=1 Tax=Streptomyces kunmingensis TaxID=68225 RepID=A0ABU6CQY4_9ACTN|nr:hypothetical protein [Streptomyces kunmingensis]MEB3967151.1 hypothetical protein [Streptomyces kunmingensis]
MAQAPESVAVSFYFTPTLRMKGPGDTEVVCGLAPAPPRYEYAP